MPQPPDATSLLAIGTYTEWMPHVDGKGDGIHLRPFDAAAGTIGPASITGGVRNPTYLTASAAGDLLYAVTEIDLAKGPMLETYAVDQAAGVLRHLSHTPIPGGWPCHLSLNPAAGHLYITAYQTGQLIVMGLDESSNPTGTLQVIQRTGSGPRADRQEASHPHCVLPSPDGRHLYLTDLGTDEIVRHPIADGRVAEEPDLVITAKPGAGPRHLVFSPSGRSLLVINELNSTITLHRTDDPLPVVAEISTLPEGWTGTSTCAAIRIHPSGRFVYASNRGDDSVFLAGFDEDAGTLRPLGHWPAGGRIPRDIALSPDGRFLLAASQIDDRVQLFTVDAETGALAATDHVLALANPVCLCFIPSESRP